MEIHKNGAQPREVLAFWFEETPEARWFSGGAAFDAEIRDRFEVAWRRAREGEFSDWQADAPGALALAILLDQFPRNMFRGQAAAFSTDAMARDVVKQAIGKDYDLAVPEARRTFFYMPLMHSEALSDQDVCIALFRERVGETSSNLPFALKHREVIARFGRFPARNAALGRANTPEETEFLAAHPAGF